MSVALAVLLFVPLQEKRSFWDREVDQTFEANEVDVDVWVKRLAKLGLDLPVELKGTISGRLNVRVPWSKALDVAAWNADGSITSERLTVAGAELNDLSVALSLSKGVLTLKDLSFRPDGSRTPIVGSGTLPVDPAGDLSLRLKLTDFDLAVLRPHAKRAGLPEPKTLGGRVTTTVEASVPPSKLTDPAAWTASGPLAVRGFTYRVVPPADLDGTLRLKDGVLRLPFEKLTAEGAAAEGDAALTLTKPFPYTIDFEGRLDGDALLLALLGGDSPVRFEGLVDVDGRLSGRFDPAAVRFRGSLAGRNLTAKAGGVPVPVERLGADGTFDDRVVAVSGLTADLLGGRVTGDAKVDLRETPGDSTAEIEFTDVDAGGLAALAKRPGAAAGELSGELKLAVRRSRWDDAAAYTGSAAVRADDLAATVGGRAFAVSDLAATVAATDTTVKLEFLTAGVGDGRFRGTGSVPKTFLDEPRTGEASFEAAWEALPVAAFAVFTNAPELSGSTSGKLRVRIPAERLAEPVTWPADGSVSVADLRVGPAEVADLNATFRADNGAGEAGVSGTAFGGELRSKLVRGDGRIAGRIRLTGTRLEDAVAAAGRLKALPPLPDVSPVAGVVSLDVTASRSGGEPLRAAGTLLAESLQAGVAAADAVRAEFTVDGPTVWADATADTLGGRVAATVTTDLSTGELNGTATATDADLSGVPPGLTDGVELSGRAGVEARFAAAGGPRPLSERLRGEVTAELSDLEARAFGRTVTAKAADVRAVATAERLWAKVSGRLLGGRIVSTASAPRALRDGTLAASLEATGVEIDQAAALAAAPEGWAGRAFADVTANVPLKDGVPRFDGLTAAGPVRVANVRYKGRSFSSQLGGVLDWSPRSRRIDSLSGTLATGQVSGSIALPSGGKDGPFQIGLSGVRTDDVGEFFGVDLPLSGRLDVSLRGSAGPEAVSATGTLSFAAGSLGVGRRSLRTTGVRVPLTVTYRPATDTMDVRVRGGRLSLSGGRVSGDAAVRLSQVRSDPKVGLDVDLSMAGLNVGQVARELGVGNLSGRLSGRVRLEADRLASASDLGGTVSLTFQDAAAGGSRIVTAVMPYLGKLTAFESGRLEATVSKGVANVRRFTASGRSLDVYADGRVTLAGRRAGRLDLDVVAATGEAERGAFRSAVVQRAITLAAPGVGVLLAATEAVRDRVVHLTVTGTVSDPRVSVRPAETAKEAGLRFLVRSAVGPAG